MKNGISAIKDGDSEKLGGATPEEAVKNYISGGKDGDYKKAINNTYFKRDEDRTKALEYYKAIGDGYRKEITERYSDIEIGKVKSINENRAIVEVKFSGDTTERYYVKKVNGRWFAENMFSY